MMSHDTTSPRSPSHRYGVATIALCVVFGLVFLVQWYVANQFMNINALMLAKLGGNAPTLTFGYGQWWRLGSAALLHGGFVHVAFNVYAMLIIGSAVERSLGAGWVVGAFVFSGITGSMLSAYANPPNVVAIGASGGIFGLVAMAAAMSYLAPRLGWFSRSILTQWLLFSLAIGFVAGFDNWGHIGGVVGGALCALVAVACKRHPNVFRKIGTVCGVIGCIVMVGCVAASIQSFLGMQAE